MRTIDYLVEARRRLRLATSLVNSSPEKAGEEAWLAFIDVVNALAHRLLGATTGDPESARRLRDRVAGVLEREGQKALAYEIRTVSGTAWALHLNYIEPGDSPETVRAGIERVKRLLEEVEPLVSRGTTGRA